MIETEFMLTSILDCRRVDLYTGDAVLSPEQEVIFARMKARREQGEPLQCILGKTEFCGLQFCVNEHVLIPRPETELMVESLSEQIAAVAKNRKSIHVLDIGTGSGCIAVALAKRFPHARCCAVDISPEALSVAQENARAHGVKDRIAFHDNDIQRLWGKFNPPSFDWIVSNPPYIPQGELSALPPDVQREPRVALDGGADGLRFYRDIIGHAAGLLTSGGGLVCEFGDGQDAAIMTMFDAQWRVEFFQDLSGVNRFFVAEYNSGQ